MRPGRHAAEDGSFRRSAGVAMGRAVLLLLVAVVVGVLLLNGIDDEGDAIVATTDTTEAKKTTSTLAPTTTSTSAARAARAPKDVKVLAVNGTGTSGVGARVNDVLKKAGYNGLAPTDAAAKVKPLRTSAVFHQPGFELEAAAVAQLLQLPPTAVQPLPADAATRLRDTRTLSSANLVVMAGEDLEPKLPAASTTSTTARATTTTARPSTTTTTARPASTTSTTAAP